MTSFRSCMTVRRALGITVFLGGIVLLWTYGVIRWNETQSLPGYMFVGIRGNVTPRVGQIVSFYHPEFKEVLGKQIVGVEGDVIEITGHRVRVRGLDRGEILEKSPRSGRPLRPVRPGVIPRGYVYVWAPHPYSFDSRYQEVGLIPVERLQERLWCIF